MTPTKQEIDSAIQELHLALEENLDAMNEEGKIKVRRIKAHNRLLLARETVRSLSFN